MSEEINTRWGLVVESDQIYSAKTGKWYPVRQSVGMPDGTHIKVWATGIPKPIVKALDDPVRVRRGPTGKAVDLFAIVFSGQTKPETVGMNHRGSMITDKVDEPIGEDKES